jgi:hypothetical protein
MAQFTRLRIFTNDRRCHVCSGGRRREKLKETELSKTTELPRGNEPGKVRIVLE